MLSFLRVDPSTVACVPLAPGDASRGVYPVPLFFFFQAEDGIRDHCVTGVQTCALPISFDVRSGRSNHLLISTVTGIAPFVSYVRTLYRDGKNGGTPLPGNHRLFCLQGASRAFEFGYREELERYSQEVPWFKYVATVTRPWEDCGWPGERGRVADLLRLYMVK